MSQIIPFSPVNTSAFTFRPVLDGASYSAVVTWNLSGQRFYLSVVTLNGVSVFTLPLIGSTDALNVSAVQWANGFVTMTTEIPHGFALWSTIPLLVSGMTPDAYNGTVQAFVIARNQFQFPLALDPGPVTAFGIADYAIDLAAGYFGSTLVFRQSSQQFEINP